MYDEPRRISERGKPMGDDPATKKYGVVSNEEWVRAWLGRKWGKQFAESHAKDFAKVKEHLDDGILIDVDPAEGVGTCSCGIEMGKDIRFLLDNYEFMSICPKCDSWSIYQTRDGKRRGRKE